MTATVTFVFTIEESDELHVQAGDITFLSDSSDLKIYFIRTGSNIATVTNGATLNIGSESNPVLLDVFDVMSIGDGTVVVSGSESQLFALGPGVSLVGAVHTGSLTVTNGATAAFAQHGTLGIGLFLGGGIHTTQGTVTAA